MTGLVGRVVVERAVEIGEGDVRLVLPVFGREAGIADGGLAAGGQALEIGRGVDAGPEGGGLAAAETAGA